MVATIEPTEVLPAERRGRGRPTLYTPERVAIILDAIRKGHTPSGAGPMANVTAESVSEWREIHPEFAEAITRAETECMDAALDRLNRCANKFGPDAKAVTFFLERRFRREFGPVIETRNENLNLNLSAQLTPERMTEIRERHRKSLERLE